MGGTYKRPAGAAPLLGMNIGGKHYDDATYQAQLARMDVVILGFYPGWKGDTDGSVIRRTVQQIKARNPALKVGQYTILNEAQDDPARTASDDKIVKLDQMNWWLRTAAGAKTAWTTEFNAYDINISKWSRADENGDRYPQWLAKRDHKLFFSRVPEFDLWYFDNVMKHSRVKAANWRMDGKDVAGTDAEIASEFRNAEAANWAAAAKLAPGLVQIGNVNSDMSQPEYRGKLGAAFLEGIMGENWSVETWGGWGAMMTRYFDVTANLKAPALVGFGVHGNPSDYKFFRYAFTSCLMGNGHFAYTDDAVGFASVPWFDEYEVALGAPLEPATKAVWSNGVSRRRYEHAMVLVNPQADARTVTIEPGWRRLLARQDPVVNNGAEVPGKLTIPAKDGIILVRK
jgi:hypothetical protein